MELLMVNDPTGNHRKCKQCWGHLSRGEKNEDTFKSGKTYHKSTRSATTMVLHHYFIIPFMSTKD